MTLMEVTDESRCCCSCKHNIRTSDEYKTGSATAQGRSIISDGKKTFILRFLDGWERNQIAE